MVGKCGLISGNSCPISRKKYKKCPFYDPNGSWCYYSKPMRKVE